MISIEVCVWIEKKDDWSQVLDTRIQENRESEIVIW